MIFSDYLQLSHLISLDSPFQNVEDAMTKQIFAELLLVSLSFSSSSFTHFVLLLGNDLGLETSSQKLLWTNSVPLPLLGFQLKVHNIFFILLQKRKVIDAKLILYTFLMKLTNIAIQNNRCTDGNIVFRCDNDKNSLVIISMF